MEKYNHKFKKKFGQNFLKDNSIVKKIVGFANIEDDSLVIEVGVGGAILTKELALVADNVLAYEIDCDLKGELDKKLKEFNNVKVLFKDFLSSDITLDISDYNYKHIYFVSNVPYYITTPIIIKLLNSGIKFDSIVMMVQKEVALRFSAVPGSSLYGSISAYLSYYYDINSLLFVSRKEFIPEPNVDSEVISFVPKKSLLSVKNINVLEKLIRDSFKFKRKNLRNNLKGYPLDKIENVLKKYDFNLSSRAEMLSIDIFVDIANEIS